MKLRNFDEFTKEEADAAAAQSVDPVTAWLKAEGIRAGSTAAYNLYAAVQDAITREWLKAQPKKIASTLDEFLQGETDRVADRAAEAAYRRGVHQALAMVQGWFYDGSTLKTIEARLARAESAANFYRHARAGSDYPQLLETIEEQAKGNNE